MTSRPNTPGRRMLHTLAVSACALALASVATFADQRGNGNVAAAPGDGFVEPSPRTLTIIEGHIVNIPVKFTTCANTGSPVCQVGAFDLTMNYNDPIFDVIQEGHIATSATATTITVSTATWKVDQWKGSLLHITNGGGFGQKRQVVSNTATTITMESAWNPPPASQPASGSIFNVGGMVEGGFLGDTGRTVSCLLPDFGTGWAQQECVTLGSEIPGPTGTGNLTNLTLKAVGRGVSTLNLTAVQVLEIDADAIPVDVFNGSRRVILCPDPNGDGRVTSIDLSLIAQQFGKAVGQTGYTVTRDPNEDGFITSIDLSLTAQVFGARCVQL